MSNSNIQDYLHCASCVISNPLLQKSGITVKHCGCYYNIPKSTQRQNNISLKKSNSKCFSSLPSGLSKACDNKPLTFYGGIKKKRTYKKTKNTKRKHKKHKHTKNKKSHKHKKSYKCKKYQNKIYLL